MLNKIKYYTRLHRSGPYKLGIEISEDFLHNQDPYVLSRFRHCNVSKYHTFEVVSG